MGKLIDLLEQAARSPSQPMGFSHRPAAEKTAPLLLVGSIAAGDAASAERVREAGLRVALLTGAEPSTSDGFETEAFGDLALGLWCDRPAAAPTEGVDFQVFCSEETAVDAMGGEGRTVFMQVVPELDDGLLRTIDALPVEGFLVSVADAPSLTVRQLMRLARVRDVTGKYLLVHIAGLPGKEELVCLRDAGVSGLVVDAASHSTEALKGCKEDLDGLPRSSGRRKEERVATLPSAHLVERSAGRERSPEEDDGEEDED